MAIERFDGTEDETRYRAWIDAHPGGFVVNTTRPNPSRNYLKLHRATCWSIRHLRGSQERFTSGGYQKVCSRTRTELEQWARLDVGGDLSPCGQCHG
jgi:hypothetical protein